jgi:hypothetical protein
MWVAFFLIAISCFFPFPPSPRQGVHTELEDLLGMGRWKAEEMLKKMRPLARAFEEIQKASDAAKEAAKGAYKYASFR